MPSQPPQPRPCPLGPPLVTSSALRCLLLVPLGRKCCLAAAATDIEALIAPCRSDYTPSLTASSYNFQVPAAKHVHFNGLCLQVLGSGQHVSRTILGSLQSQVQVLLEQVRLDEQWLMLAGRQADRAATSAAFNCKFKSWWYRLRNSVRP